MEGNIRLGRLEEKVKVSGRSASAIPFSNGNGGLLGLDFFFKENDTFCLYVC